MAKIKRPWWYWVILTVIILTGIGDIVNTWASMGVFSGITEIGDNVIWIPALEFWWRWVDGLPD